MITGINREVFSDISYGLYILTSINGEQQNGQIINTLLQVTSEPPRVAVIVNKTNLTHEYILKSGVFGVSVLEEDTPLKFLGIFGFRSGRDIDKLAQVQFMEGSTGCPLVTDHSLAVLEAKVHDELDVGTHTLFVGDVVDGTILKAGHPLTYQFYRTHLKGKASKKSPTFNPGKA
jgi:ferric-chelate reductase [NAD(P)H]